MTETAAVTAPARSGRALRIVIWASIGVVAALLVVWFVAAKNPSLAPAGMSWQSDAFVNEASPGSPNEGVWVTWDRPEGAWASVVVKNDRPYAVTLSPGVESPLTKVQIAAYDIDSTNTVMDAEAVEAVQELRVPAGGNALVSLHVSDRCSQMEPGSSAGTSSASVEVTALGVTSQLEVPFPGTYLAGTTAGHDADPACPKP